MEIFMGKAWKCLIITASIALVGAVAFASGRPGMTADEALKMMMDGNKRYVENQMQAQKHSDPAMRQALARSQKPYAIVLSCSDSRVPPEIIFDKGLGEIFVIRVAGNIPDSLVLGSIEYAAEHLGSPLIMVLGHERCGAVTATVEAKGKPQGNIGAIVKTISPAVKQAKKEYKGNDKSQLVEKASDINIKMVSASIIKGSPVIRHLVKEGKVKIVDAKYDLDDGKVTLMK